MVPCVSARNTVGVAERVATPAEAGCGAGWSSATRSSPSCGSYASMPGCLHHGVHYAVSLSEVEWPDRRLGVSGIAGPAMTLTERFAGAERSQHSGTPMCKASFPILVMIQKYC